MSDQQSHADAAEVASLIQTALYDTGGETVEGGFVDRWEPYALTAIDELKEIFQRRGFTPADEELLRRAICEPGAPTAAAVVLLKGLRPISHPLLERLLTSDSAEGRAAALETLGEIRSPGEALAGLSDPSALVRHAALRGLIAGRLNATEANPHLIHALDDPNPHIRSTAAENLDFGGKPEAANALIGRYRREGAAAVREAILTHIVETVRREGVHYEAEAMRRLFGGSIQAFLLEQMAEHEDPKMRYEVARALERLPSPEVARAFLQRLQVEKEPLPRSGLLYYPAFREIKDEAFPILVSLLSDPSPAMRTGVAFALESFGPEAIPNLIQRLDDPEEHIRRAAAMSLGKCRAGVALPRLLQELWDRPRNWRYEREFESAVRDVAFYVPGPPAGAPDEELSATIQARVEALAPTHLGEWPVRVCKEDLNALPLHSTQIYQWCLQPDGTLLRWDHEAIRLEAAPEDRARARFAVMVHGAVRYPELTPLIPKLPENVRLCHYCKGQGWYATREATNVPCMTCDYLGWIERQ